MNLQLTIMTPPPYKRFGFFTTHKSKNSIYMKYHENSEKIRPHKSVNFSCKFSILIISNQS